MLHVSLCLLVLYPFTSLGSETAGVMSHCDSFPFGSPFFLILSQPPQGLVHGSLQ